MSIKAFLLIIYLQTALSAVVAFFALYKYKTKDATIKLIGFLFCTSFLCNVAGLSLQKSGIIPLVNLPGTVYDITFVITALIIYDRAFNRSYRTSITMLGVLFLAWAATNLLFFQELQINSYTKLPGAFLVTVYAILFFYKILVDLPTIHLNRFPMFWFNSGFLIYCASSIFLYAFIDYLVSVLQDDLTLYWSIHNMLFIVQDIFILCGLGYDLAGKTKPLSS